jgi:hypothetical protein
VVAAAVALTAAGCGFDEKLTSRGFVKAGDGLCNAALGRAVVATQSPGGASGLDAEGVAALAQIYTGMAEALRSLELRDEDEAMRDEMVRRYGETGSQIRSLAADAAAGDPSAPASAVAAIDELEPFSAELREYGFRVCGGREQA